MLIAQITDTHIKPKGGLAYGNLVDTATSLKNIVEHCNKFMPKIDMAIVTGDLTDSGIIEEYETFNKIIELLEMPWFLIPGNHDNIRNIFKFFSTHKYLPRNENFCNYVIDEFPFNLIGLDTTVPGQSFGKLCEERLRWLDLNLNQYQDKPTFLFMHHHPFVSGIDGMDNQNMNTVFYKCLCVFTVQLAGLCKGAKVDHRNDSLVADLVFDFRWHFLN